LVTRLCFMKGPNLLTIRLRLALTPARNLLLAALLVQSTFLNAACRQSATSPSPSPQSQNKAGSEAKATAAKLHTEIGFASRQKFLDHFDKHGGEFGSISKEEYLRRAQTLRDGPVGSGVLEVTRADGVVTRFDKQTGAFLAFNSDLTIRTFFKPNDGENYFRRQAGREAGKRARKERDNE